MKALYTCLLLLALSFTNTKVLAQNELYNFDNRKDIQSITVNKKMFELISNVPIGAMNSSDQEYFDLIKKLDFLKVLSASQAKPKEELYRAISTLIISRDLTTLELGHASIANLHLYAPKDQTNPNDLRELLMYYQEPDKQELYILFIQGHFKISEIKNLAQKMNFPTPF